MDFFINGNNGKNKEKVKLSFVDNSLKSDATENGVVNIGGKLPKTAYNLEKIKKIKNIFKNLSTSYPLFVDNGG